MVHHYIQRTIEWCTIIYSAPFNGAPRLRVQVLMVLHPLASDPYLGLKAAPRAAWRLWPTLAEPLGTDPVTEARGVLLASLIPFCPQVRYCQFLPQTVSWL